MIPLAIAGLFVFHLAAATAEESAEPCPVPTQTVCVREIEPKTKTHTRYRLKTRTICLTTCKPCGPCGRPREVRVLIKRFVKEETSTSVCKPRQVPACCDRP
jgi:hypothetical protein